MEKKRLEKVVLPWQRAPLACHTHTDWTGIRPMKAPVSLALVDPMSITAIKRISTRHVKGGGVEWKCRITDNWGYTATLTGNADTLAYTRNGPLVPDNVISILQRALAGGKIIRYSPDPSDRKSRLLAMKSIERKAYRLYRRYFLAQSIDDRRSATELMNMVNIPSEAFRHIMDKYVTDHFDDRSGRWVSTLKPYDG